MNCREAALRYAAFGVPVIPVWNALGGRCSCHLGLKCKSPGKHPVHSLCPKGLDDASTDSAVVAAWWKEHPDACVAGRMGAGVAVAIDADGRTGLQSLEDLQLAYGEFPLGPVQRTGGGGLHLFFAHPGGYVAPAVNAFEGDGFPGIDVRADKSYVLLDPSTHVSGGRYEFLVDQHLLSPGLALPPIPEWLLKLLQTRSEIEYGEIGNATGIPIGRAAKELLAGRVPMGMQRLEAVKCARNLQGAGVDPETAIGMILEGLTKGPQDASKPWTRADVEKLVRSVYGSRAPAPQPLRNAASAEEFAAAPTPEQLQASAALIPETPPEERRFRLTDLGNAERMVDAWGKDLRHCALWKRWLTWDGTRWLVDETDGSPVHRMAQKTVRQMYAEAANTEDADERKKLAKWAHQCEGKSRVDAMISMARTQEGISIVPDDLDRQPWLFTAANGTIDLRNGKLRKARRADLGTKLAPCEYVEDAPCNVWKRFLSEIFAGREELVRFVQKAVGYSLTGDVSEQVMFFAHGAGANGKSTFVETIVELLGGYGIETPSETFMVRHHEGISNDVARLKGARFVAAPETADGKRLDEAKIKQLTGGDRVVARYLHAEFFEFAPTFKIWMYGNHKPTIRGVDEGIWRRLRLIPFDVTIPEARRDKTLKARLSLELPGILAWAVKGCLMWQEEGLGEPAEIADAVAAYREEMDVLGSFLEECTERDQFGHVPARSLYSAYKLWAKQTGAFELSETRFGAQLQARGIEKKRLKTGIVYEGLLIKDEQTNDHVYRGSSD